MKVWSRKRICLGFSLISCLSIVLSMQWAMRFKTCLEKARFSQDVTCDSKYLSPAERAEYVQMMCKRLPADVEREIFSYIPDANAEFSAYQSLYGARRYVASNSYPLNLCVNLKVGGSNLNRILYALDHNIRTNISSIHGRKSWSYYFSKYMQLETHPVEDLRHYVNVTFVREPLERLLSAYRDKMGGRGLPYLNVTFTTFLRSIEQSPVDPNSMNPHHFPYFHRCLPCHQPPSFIGHQATYDRDVRLLLTLLNAHDIIPPARKATGYNDASEDNLQKYFKDVPCQLVHKIWLKYVLDYKVFGFPYPSHIPCNKNGNG